MMVNQGNMRQMRYARSWTHRSLAGKEAVIIVSQKKDLVHRRCWIREGKGETETVNQLDKDRFHKTYGRGADEDTLISLTGRGWSKQLNFHFFNCLCTGC